MDQQTISTSLMNAPRASSERFAIRAAAFASFAIPAALGILFASPEPYWLDSPEFTAAAQTLGLPHPPGHPLYVMLAKPFTLLPFGGIAFRVSLASALFGAMASLLLFHVIFRILEICAGVLATWVLATCALSATLLAAVAPGWWFQCVRQEVYSLQILLVLGALYPFILYCLRPSTTNERYLYASAFFMGLGIANHHFIMLAAFPAAIPPIVNLARTKTVSQLWRLILKLAAAGAFGMLPYLFLPIRSISGAPVSLGGVHSVSDFLWVVTAKVYQKSMTKQFEAGLHERTLDSLFTMMGQIGPVIVTASLIGFYMLLRNRRTRMTGIVLTLITAVGLLLRATMGFDPFNPDYYGYMLPVVAGLVTGFAVFLAVTLAVLVSNVKIPRSIPITVAVAALMLPVLRAKASRPETDLSDFRATRIFRDFCLESALPETVMLATYYNLFFVLSSARFIDGSRPDLVIVNPMLLSYPGYLSSTLSTNPELMPLARSMLVHGKLTESAAAALALNHPVRIEPDIYLDDAVIRYMIPDAPLFHTAPEPLGQSDVAASAPAYLNKSWRRFYRLLGSKWREHETWRMLAWSHFKDAVFLARVGDHDDALVAVRMAQALGNESTELSGLSAALEKGGTSPVDVRAYLPRIQGAPSNLGQNRNP